MTIHAGKAKQTVTAQFQDVALPRTVRVEYPRSPRALSQDWTQRSGLLVAEYQNTAIGYISLDLNTHERITWVADFAVEKNLRWQGIGSALAISALDWCTDHSSRYLIFAFQPKNHPAIKLAKKLGFGFSGFQDHYFRNLDFDERLGRCRNETARLDAAVELFHPAKHPYDFVLIKPVAAPAEKQESAEKSMTSQRILGVAYGFKRTLRWFDADSGELLHENRLKLDGEVQRLTALPGKQKVFAPPWGRRNRDEAVLVFDAAAGRLKKRIPVNIRTGNKIEISGSDTR